MRVKKAGNEVMCAVQCCSVPASRVAPAPSTRNRADTAVGRRRRRTRALESIWPPARAHALDRGRMHAILSQ